MGLFGNRLKYVTCKTWDATHQNFDFPEWADQELKMDELTSRPNVGLCFSGGGTRSAAATLGQLRGLNELNLLEGVRYLSCVSGGSWACVPFAYLPSDVTDETFLGQFIEPKDLTADSLKVTDDNSLAHAISHSVLIDDFIKHATLLAGDETYSRAIGGSFLSPFDLDSRKRFFTLDDKSVSSILGRNSKMEEDDFYQISPGRPYLIVGSTLLRVNNRAPLPTKIRFETTPLYAGSLVLHKKAGSSGRDIGGGYLEPFGFDSNEPDEPPNQKNVVTVRLGASRHRYALSDVVGASGAAPAEVLDKICLGWIGFPEFNHWPVPTPHKRSAKEYTFGGRGLLENLGILPMLMRRVERIVVFVNTKSRLKGGKKGQINDSIPPLFGQTPKFKLNHVFPEDPAFLSITARLYQQRYASKQPLFMPAPWFFTRRPGPLVGISEADILSLLASTQTSLTSPRIRRMLSPFVLGHHVIATPCPTWSALAALLRLRCSIRSAWAGSAFLNSITGLSLPRTRGALRNTPSEAEAFLKIWAFCQC